MAAPSVTYTFVNGTTASATEVNTNFTDIINGVSDTTKDLSINALTCAGNATFNGNMTFGNASSDTITFTGSLSSTIPITTTYSYDLGSTTKGLKNIYLGSDDSAARTTLLKAGTVGTSNTLTFPITDGTIGLNTDASSEISNLSIACSVAGSALTIALKNKAGSDASASSPIKIGFRNSTNATGTYTQVLVTGALSTVISSGSTAGFKSGKTHYLNVYLINNAGAAELAWSQCPFDISAVITTTAEGGAGAADSNAVMYSTTARSNVPAKMVASLKFSLTTAGTWDEVPDVISLTDKPQNDFIFAHYTHTAGQSVSSATPTVIDFETLVNDTHNCVIVGASWKFTPLKNGTYSIVSRIIHTQHDTAMTAGSRSFLAVRRSGSNDKILSLDTPTGVGTYPQFTLSGTCEIALTTSEYIDISLDQNTTNTAVLNTSGINCYVMVRRIGD